MFHFQVNEYPCSANQIVVEAKSNVVSRITSFEKGASHNLFEIRTRFCEELLTILDKLGVGANEVRNYLENEKARKWTRF